MRKPRRLSPDELAPWSVELPGLRQTRPPNPLPPGGRGDRTTDHPAAPGSQLSALHLAPPPPRGEGSAAPLDWPALFGNPHPVEVEVGMGKGLFLLTEALARPGVNFFGIEVVRKYQLYAATRLAIRKLPNAKTSCADAGRVFRELIPPGSVSAVHVLFPDPWWKKRHRKRRVFTPAFAADVARALPVGGRLHVASDVAEYFGVMTGILRAMPAFRGLAAETTSGPLEEAGFRTNFERKARLAGTPVGRAVYERTAGPVTVAPDPAGEQGSREGERPGPDSNRG
ncbi:MAG: tRNA (guanosine(46)-N7)-methyltransferase TrmB [Gemmataceae bacterium]|nr:tRNA (guanosine(46)-N7)-methyltransferase TrmB [Gemmataceae bacterium]